MACKTYEDVSDLKTADHIKIAIEAFNYHKGRGEKVTPSLLKKTTQEIAKKKNQLSLIELLYEESEIELTNEVDVINLYSGQQEQFQRARNTALHNTRIYLSLCNDLDVYIATSMRTRNDFREMANNCEKIFSSDELQKYNLRYFDPTLSAAKHHEDKGIIECLMVKKAKVLIYFAQHKESLGKVSEYAMALSLGKPVIILCPDDLRGIEVLKFYKEKHPLTRLVDFTTGVVHGSIVTNKISDVSTLLNRIFSNQMEYDIIKKAGREAYYLLKERLTQSTVRIITDDKLLTETFWNYYKD